MINVIAYRDITVRDKYDLRASMKAQCRRPTPIRGGASRDGAVTGVRGTG